MVIVTCEKCNTRYRVSEDVIGSKGTKVKCTKCGHVFLIKPERGKTKKRVDKKVIYGLVGLVLVVSAFIGYSYFSKDITRITGAFKKQQYKNIKGVVLEDVKQYFVENDKMGKLLVIEGKATNKSKLPKKMIKIRATLLSKNGRVISRKTIYAGNTLSLYQLQMFTQKEIEESLSSKIGILTKNKNIPPGKSVPFMVVFYNPPEKVSEFTLQITQALTIKVPLKNLK